MARRKISSSSSGAYSQRRVAQGRAQAQLALHGEVHVPHTAVEGGVQLPEPLSSAAR